MMPISLSYLEYVRTAIGILPLETNLIQVGILFNVAWNQSYEMYKATIYITWFLPPPWQKAAAATSAELGNLCHARNELWF